jgi:CheY-like chemotaxis protein
LRFSVNDTGIGIPADRLDRLFNKFSQVDASTTRRFGGTGLGLAISRQLAEHMGGAIGVTSEPNQGSRFWFTVRLEAQKTPKPEATPPEWSRARVLVVDDNATSRDILSAQLASWGLRATPTSDGPGALALLAEALQLGDPYQVAVVDLEMPGMDGVSLGRAVRSDPRLAALPLVLMNPLAKGDEAAQDPAIKFAAHLRKPIRASELKKILSGCLVPERGATTHALPTEPPRGVFTPRRFEGCNTRVLLAEDNPINQVVAVGMLGQLGLQADVVANGVEAVRAVETGAYDIVLMDVQMPEMDGLEAARVIRNLDSNGDRRPVTIIAVTAHAMRGDAESCLAAGMDDYLAKPLSTAALAETLTKWGLRKP